MGQSVTCSCGQRNSLDSYRFGEPRQCIACGQLLPHKPVELPELPKAETDAGEPVWADEPRAVLPTAAGSATSGFESPSGFEEDETASDSQSSWGVAHTVIPPLPEETPRVGFESPSGVQEPVRESPPERQWAGGVREGAQAQGAAAEARCAKCQRPFRGEWDKHERWDGIFCHICATQADPNYRPPDQQTRRELYRPAPPKKLEPKHAEDDSEVRDANRKKKRELALFCGVAAGTLLLVNVLPVETWVAMFFAADLSQVEETSSLWRWVIYVSKFGIGAVGHMAALYVALSLSNQLHPGGFEQNWGPILYLGIAFEILNTVLAVMAFLFSMIPFGIVLIGIAFVIMVTMKYMMVSARFHIGFEGFVGFFLSWFLASLMLKPCVFALHKLVEGFVAAIAL